MELLVNVKDVKKVYGGNGKKPDVLAVDTINLKIMRNEFITILGTSGCGKSTLL